MRLLAAKSASSAQGMQKKLQLERKELESGA